MIAAIPQKCIVYQYRNGLLYYHIAQPYVIHAEHIPYSIRIVFMQYGSSQLTHAVITFE